MEQRGEVLWSPPPDAWGRSNLGSYRVWLDRQGVPAAGGPSSSPAGDAYDALWRWSVSDIGAFWQTIRDYFGIGVGESSSTGTPALAEGRMPGARWFPGAILNYAGHVFGDRAPASGPVAATSPPDPASPAVVARSQTRGPTELTYAELLQQVALCRVGLQRIGVQRDDRVVAYLPNIPEALVAMLATASLGAIWSSCPPEFGVRSVADRFRQIEPAVLLAVDGYRYGAREVVRSAELAAIRKELPTLRATVTVPYLDPQARFQDSITWDELLAGDAGRASEVEAQPVRFDHPLYVLYSSGTTGLPKPIVHGHGGILLEHCKVLGLHGDLGPGDRFFWFSTTGWMMWNYLVSGLLVGATVVLFDGDPGYPDLGALWRLAGEVGVTYLGVSAPFLWACRREGVRPAELADLSPLRTVGSTGAPLPPEGFRWVYEQLGSEVLLSSVSGGTDVCTAFVGGQPVSPVRAGEISCRYLGAKVEAFGPDSRPAPAGHEGELVVTAPMPSMPVGLWGDSDGSRYRAAYFASHAGVWAHGDWITIYEDGACVISGRADATLNRGGVRMGTAELYAVVESLPEVADSLVVHLEDPEGGPGRLLLFVVRAANGGDGDPVAPAGGAQRGDAPQPGDELRDRIARALRQALSPRHVPDEVHEVPAVPRTLSGKKLEVPVKRILTGTDPDLAASRGSLADPDSLDPFITFYAKSRSRPS